MAKTYTFHSDPGHGWLEIPKSDLAALGPIPISSSSYEDEHNVYLEEDADASRFLRAAEQAGWDIETLDAFVEGSSFVRGLPSFEG